MITSVSGGKTSAYVAKHYASDHLVFSLIRIEDKVCQYPDKKIRQLVEDKIQAPFIGTAEDDIIIQTMLELEQYLGQEINWVTGITFDKVIKDKGGWLPNKLHRYCTTHMKIEPIFNFWQQHYKQPTQVQIGFRANEKRRVKNMEKRLNKEGATSFKTIVGRSKTGTQNKWAEIPWQIPVFPLVQDNIFKDTIHEFWKDKPVTFAPLNNCVGCHHRNPLLLRKMFTLHPNKMEWFMNQEGGSNGFWKAHPSQAYNKIKEHRPQYEMQFDDFSECDNGFCEL